MKTALIVFGKSVSHILIYMDNLLQLFLACAIALTQAASHDVEWIYGMTENELCVAPGVMMMLSYLKYSDIFSKLNISGDIVNFIWETNHNVDPVATKEDYDNCVFTNTEPEAGPLAWTAPEEEGITYVVCGVSVHCTSGNQKLAITVSNSC